MSNDLRRAKKKLLAVRRAERRLLNRLADIDWEEAELFPEVERLEQGAAKGELPQISVVRDADPNR